MQMTKLSQKFILGIVVILVFSSLCSILFNARFLSQYYLYQKKTAITKICNEFTSLLAQGISSDQAIEQIETSNKIIIAEIENQPFSDNNKVNSKIQSAFQEKGVGFQKYWLWEEDYNRILEGEKRIRLYQQENLNYSLLIDYMQIDTSLYALTMIVPNIADAFGIANRFLIFVNISTIFLSIIFMFLLIRRITKPLHAFEDFAQNMQKNQFIPIQIDTKDELDSVAKSLNVMGSQIISYQESLQDKNIQMEQLLDNAAHDLKTPLSLIQLYANGIKDGLDDGTFLDTILEESQQMSTMVNHLLYIAQMDKKSYEMTQINLSDLLQNIVNKYSLFAEENNVIIHSHIEPDICLSGVEELIKSLFFNLISNAVKYCAGDDILLELYKANNQITFLTKNDISNDTLDLSKIWTPYYVGEQSRNKKLSGTGLGLSIVNKICETQHYTITCSLEMKKITFTVTIPI